jgi:LysR family nitrogen assimilation transcriptional regulator
MDVETIRAFLRVAASGNLTRAAESLGLPQPTLSRMIKVLEREAGAPLFVRTRRGVHPTEAGKRFAERCRGIVSAIEDAIAEIAPDRAPAGHVSVGIPHSMTGFIARPLVEWFAASFPRSVISLQQGVSDELEQSLALGETDVGILISPQTRAPLIALRAIAIDQVHLLMPPGETLRQPKADWKDLKGRNIILPRKQNQLRRRAEAAAKRLRFPLQVVAESSTPDLTLSLVEAGLGVSLLPGCASERARSEKRVRGHPMANTEVVWTLARSPQSPPSKLCDLIEEKIRELVAGRARKGAWRLPSPRAGR